MQAVFSLRAAPVLEFEGRYEFSEMNVHSDPNAGVFVEIILGMLFFVGLLISKVATHEHCMDSHNLSTFMGTLQGVHF